MSMNIQELAKLGNITSPNKTLTSLDGNSVFDGLYQSAINMLDQTNQLQKSAQQMGVDFAVGKIDNIHDVMIAQEKASVALQYTVKLNTAILDAYNEIMRMQI